MTRRNLLKIALLVALTIMFAACGKQPDWLIVTGSAVPPDGKPAAQGKLMAKRAAEVDARRVLLEQIKGTRIDSDTYVKDFMTQSDSVRSDIEGLIKGAQIVATRFNDDGTVEVDMKIDMNRVKKLVK